MTAFVTTKQMLVISLLIAYFSSVTVYGLSFYTICFKKLHIKESRYERSGDRASHSSIQIEKLVFPEIDLTEVTCAKQYSSFQHSVNRFKKKNRLRNIREKNFLRDHLQKNICSCFSWLHFVFTLQTIF